MDALLAFLPQINYWVIALAVSVALNIWQALYHTGVASGLEAQLGHVFEHGHAPEGKAIVPAASVTAAPAPPNPTTTDPQGYL